MKLLTLSSLSPSPELVTHCVQQAFDHNLPRLWLSTVLLNLIVMENRLCKENITQTSLGLPKIYPKNESFTAHTQAKYVKIFGQYFPLEIDI